MTAPASATSSWFFRFSWTRRYLACLLILSTLWVLLYTHIRPASAFLVHEVAGLGPQTRAGAALAFFLYDTAKIFLLLAALIYGISWLRASLNVEVVRDALAGKKRILGYFLGALFGAITPFCSCSSIPLFLGFTMARIPVGITMAFLVTSPLINEIAVVLLSGLLAWKFTVLYVAVGLAAGMLGGAVMDFLQAERWLQPFVREALAAAPAAGAQTTEDQTGDRAGSRSEKLTLQARHLFARTETWTIVRRIWKWVFLGVGLGSLLHGFVPDNWFAEHFATSSWWSVPAAVLVAIPLYSNVTGIVPIMESLLVKGLPLGTTMAFCMAAVAASLPEMMLLRQIMTLKLQAVFLGYLWILFTLVGWLFNALAPFLL